MSYYDPLINMGGRMAAGDRELIGRGLELLAAGLGPFVDRQMTATRGRNWLAGFEQRDSAAFGGIRSNNLTDVRFLLRVITEERQIFHNALPRPGVSLASQLREVGNTYGHDFSPTAFSPADTAGHLIAMARLLQLAGASTQAGAVRQLLTTTRQPPGAAPHPAPTSLAGGTPPPGRAAHSGDPGAAPARGEAGRPSKPGLSARRPVLFGILVVGGVTLTLLILAMISFVVGEAGPGPTPTPTQNKYRHVKNGTRLGAYRGIKLSGEHFLDLTDPKHPQESEGDLYFNGVRGDLKADRLAVLDAGDAGSYQACRDNTDYARNPVTPRQVQGRAFCVTRDDGVLGLLTITSDHEPTGKRLTLDLTVWKGPQPQ
ncbi:Swt1 family HEPN domain-containing protein [Actinomadura nitritigenes]|uniref:Swt1 family HEPN domain-containing protein n=1 Tax=Actinomadura nitritigenes TaxID=134602 RepID=UPI003D93C432